MATYGDFRKVLQKLNFALVRSTKHETWERICEDGTILRTRVSHQHGKDVPKPLFHRMLKQCKLTETRFRDLGG
ncbi:MAG: type II toxin-antitoxin system HicA family toxin [bacterium]|nr:type II toxin-antitoxin system HicA family toxin [bacterium]